MVNCMECIHIDVCIKAATSHIDHCNNYSFALNTVEVVRCKDCKKCLIDNSKMELHLCMKWPSFPVRVKLDDFCSCGERKDCGYDG